MISVGIERTPYLIAVRGFSSILSLAIFTLPPSSMASSARAGAMAWHGPHHSAQKSTTTGEEDFRTSLSNETSVTATVADGFETLLASEALVAGIDMGNPREETWAER